MNALESRLDAIVRDCSDLMAVLRGMRALDLPDWLVFSGAVYQGVWNHLTGRPPRHGVKDYDVGYFDPDTSWEAEDAVIRRVATAFEPPFDRLVEVRNQARVHLWFEQRFGEPYEPLSVTVDALGRFVAPAFAVGVRLAPDERLLIAAPFGLEDLFDLRLRANPMRPSASFRSIAEGVRRRWPEVVIDA